MADDPNSRYRSNDPFGRGPSAAAPGNDPLAELARLIGQNDPFSEHGRDSGAPAPRDAYYGSDPAPQYANNSGYAGNPAPSYGSEPAYYGNEPAPQYAANSHQPAYNNEPAPAYSDPQHYTPVGAPPANSNYADPFVPPAPAADAYATGNYQAPPYAAAPFPQPTYPHEPENGPMPPPHGDDFYDDAPRNRGRKGLLTVMAVFGLAVIGTAGAFGYRSLFGSTRSSSPPVIRASGEPSKVAPPATAAVDPSTGKISYDRFGDRGQNEQVVAREEQPLDPKDLARSAMTRGTQPSNPTSTTATSNAPSALGEPRRVRTVPIKPDSGDASAARTQPVAPAPAPSAPPPQRQAAIAMPASPPQDISPTPHTPPPVTTRARSSRTASRNISSPAAPPAGANAPLSLSPDGNNNALPPPAASREISAPPPPPAPRATSAPTRLSSSAAAAGGGYLVQVSSQKSQSDAKSSYRNIQTKYSSVIGSHQHVIRRADLGAKGVYYRAMVGPVSTREQAVQLCSSLKAAGGDCVIQSN